MASTELEGPWTLSEAGIDNAVTQTAPGAYALGQTGDNGNYLISYVGRSDDDLNGRLKDHVGSYHQFKASYFPDAKSAFERECRMYHDFGGPEGKLQNKVHPARPGVTNLRCPNCRA